MPTPPCAAPWPIYDLEQINVAVRVLQSGKVNYWTGTEGIEFEKEFAEWAGTTKAIAVANGTVSIELIVKALGLAPGDEVITTPRTFIASSSTLVIHGIRPILADVDLDSGNITPDTVATKITSKTRAILPVHLGGWPCDMEGLVQLAADKKLHIIEDCAQAHGARIGDRSVGTFGVASSWSFCQDKIITTGGEGGMVTTDDEGLWAKMWSYKDHGKDFDSVFNRQHPPGFRWHHEQWGTNFRLTELQSALGRVQLKKMPEWHQARKENALHLVSRLAGLEALRIPLPSENVTHAWYRLYLYIRPEALKDGWSRSRIIDECGANGLPLMVGSCSEIYLEKCFSQCRLGPEERLPNAKELGETSIALTVHPGLSKEWLDWVADIITKVAKEATA